MRFEDHFVDLIALDGERVVFVEVKTRRSGSPAEAVTLEKQRNLTRAALHFLKRHHLLNQPIRFDVVAIVWPDDSRKPTIQHYRNAFPAADLPRSSF